MPALLPPIGVAHLTALELPPVEFVRAVAQAGFASVGLRIAPAAPGATCYPIKADSSEARALKSALAEEGVTVNEVEFIPMLPAFDWAIAEHLLELGGDIGARSLTVSGDDPDPVRLADTLARLCEMACPYKIRIDVEFMRWRVVASYRDAVDLLKRAGHANAGILLDVLHLDRSGGTVDELDLSASSPIHAIQLSDATADRPVTDDDVIAEAREGRLIPGTGALPLADIIRRNAGRASLSVEVPDASRPATERLQRAADAARTLIQTIGADHAQRT